jgi:hypothetical protein
MKVTRDEFLRSVQKAEDNVIDSDLAVDQRRDDLHTAIESLQGAVRQRDRAVRHLADLIRWSQGAA